MSYKTRKVKKNNINNISGGKAAHRSPQQLDQLPISGKNFNIQQSTCNKALKIEIALLLQSLCCSNDKSEHYISVANDTSSENNNCSCGAAMAIAISETLNCISKLQGLMGNPLAADSRTNQNWEEYAPIF